MASSYSYPEMSASKIATALTEMGIATISAEALAAPTVDLAFQLYSGFFNYLQPPHDKNGEFDSDAIPPFGNPDLRNYGDDLSLCHWMKELLVSINYNGFSFSDILCPEPRRMIQILSAILNFIYFWEEKLTSLQDVMDKAPAYEDRRIELEERLNELKKQNMDYEVARQMEEPMVHELLAQVNKLKQSVQDYNKQQMNMRNQDKELNEKLDAIDGKISQLDFELLKKAEENSELLSKVVQSPERLQRALEEKRKKLAEVKNPEMASIQYVQEKNAALEMYTKAFGKLSKLSSQEHALLEQVNSAKNTEKDVKALKIKLSDDTISFISIESKMLELQGKVKQAEELLRAVDEERNLRLSEDIHKINNAKAESDYALKCLETRERKLEDMLARDDSLRREAESVRKAEKLKQQGLMAKFEEVLDAFHSNSNRTTNSLQYFDAEVKPKHDNIAAPGMPPTDAINLSA